jgi:magnesium and cobalt transporter
MSTDHVFPIAGFCLSLVLGGVFSAMESVLLAMNRARRLQLFGDEHPQPMDEQNIFRETKDVYFVSRLGLCATLVSAGFCAFQVIWLTGLFRSPLGAGLAMVLLVPPPYAFAVFGLPRLLSRQTAAEAAEGLPGWMRAFMRFVRPLAILSRLAALPPIRDHLPHHQLTKSDLVSLVTDLDPDENDPDDTPDGESNGADEDEETDEEEIIYNILDLEETLVREVMEPVNSVVAVRLGVPTQSVRDLSAQTGYSRFPVYREKIVALTGYVSIYDILSDPDPDKPLDAYVQPAYFVPEFMRVSRLLQEFQNRKIDAAIVVDEYGGTSGWVTREDVLEEIVGEIEDEFDTLEHRIRKCDDGAYLVNGALDTDDLAEELPLTFEEPQYDTLAGFILMVLGRIPKTGERIETDEAVFTVERMESNRIAEVRIELRGAADRD